jgi:rRNA maturation endonuclease Nob1
MTFYGTLNWKKCKKCGKMFDIGTNKDLCPECRKRGGLNNGRRK